MVYNVWYVLQQLTKKEGSAAFESKTSLNNLRRRKNYPFCCNRLVL
jgi:hypothetical protein